MPYFRACAKINFKKEIIGREPFLLGPLKNSIKYLRSGGDWYDINKTPILNLNVYIYSIKC